MLSRNRVLNAINHEQVDYIPRDLGGIISGISKIAYERFLDHMKISFDSVQISDRVQQLAHIHESVLAKLRVDTRHIRANPSYQSESPSQEWFKDRYGIKYHRVGTSEIPILYYEMVSYPLANATLQEVAEYNLPSPSDEWFVDCAKKAKTFWNQGFAVVADPMSGGILEQTKWLRGFDQFITDLYENREIVDELLDKNLDNQILIWEKWLENVGEWVSIILYGDDYGSQDRLLMHPDMWRDLIKPRVKNLVHSIKKEFSHIKVQLHSCGSVTPIIPDLIEIGIDILNPVQPRAKGMDHVILKEKFGKQLCFHGGVDIQEVLPHGTPEDVTQEIKRVSNTLGADNTGYIFAMAHNILADVPPKNITAVFDALDQVDPQIEK
ncbi:MAG: uroporphyrinogen decarboxylase family protein [Candidatus Hodarchaeales archaeon]|jgi:uroporphyrinogen decarboxylase